MKFIKVPEGCRRMSANVGLTDEVILYFKLKSMRVDGFFKTGLGVSEISRKFSVNDRTVRRWFARLQECGLMYKTDSGTGLISYNKLYTILGFDMNPNKRNTRLGRFKIFKINASDVKIVGTIATKEEIKLNQHRQAYMMQKKHKPTPIGKPDNKVGILCGTSLSCVGLANLLGYKSTSSAHRAELLLTGHKQATVTKHLEVVEVGRPDQIFKAHGRFFSENGILFKTMPNRIHITN